VDVLPRMVARKLIIRRIGSFILHIVVVLAHFVSINKKSTRWYPEVSKSSRVEVLIRISQSDPY
jgi:hypothetical protein